MDVGSTDRNQADTLNRKPISRALRTTRRSWIPCGHYSPGARSSSWSQLWPCSSPFFSAVTLLDTILNSTFFPGWKSLINGSRESCIHAGQHWRTGDTAKRVSCFIHPRHGLWGRLWGRCCPGNWRPAPTCGSRLALLVCRCLCWHAAGCPGEMLCLPRRYTRRIPTTS